jgi:glycosyltransferase involved in cell wall biosynthesis
MTESNFDHVIAAHNIAEEKSHPQIAIAPELDGRVADGIGVALLTGCQDRPYACGLAMALTAKGLRLEVVGSDEVDSSELHTTSSLRFVNLRGRLNQYDPIVTKLSKLAVYYVRLIRFVAHSNSKILHILWNNKFESFDRTFLMLYYKLCGKKISLTAHNVNQAKRDSKDSLLNRLTLRTQYRLSDHIFVHTRRMKTELCQDFGVAEKAVTVIRHPINDAFPDTDLTPIGAKKLLGLRNDERTILFLGRLRPYKGIEHLLAAFQQILAGQLDYRLVVAGAPNKGDEGYLDELRRLANRDLSQGKVLLRAEFIPDNEMEVYLKAADVLVLPYKDIFQSGVLFLAYSFGLPVVATDVGSFREEIIEGKTGFICKPDDPAHLAATLMKFFSSDLYKDLHTRRGEIMEYANRVHSWNAVAELTRNAYAEMLGNALT